MYLTTPVDDPAAWRSDDMARRDDWTVSLSNQHLDELNAAIDAAERSAVELFEIDRERFPLPRLCGVLSALLDEIEGGRGFVVLRGLPVTHWSEQRCRMAMWGMGTHLGWAEPQDGAGSLLHDVRDIGRKFGTDDNIRYFQTNQAIEFHNDGADIFALGCLRAGREGGRSRIVSAVEVLNEIIRRRPDLAVVLQQDFHVDARGQRADGKRCQVLPIYATRDGALSILLKLAYIRSAQRFDDVPRLTVAQRDALDLLIEVMEEDGMALEFDLQTGDVLIASNHTVLHGRTAFEDHDEPTSQRHMLRLWLTIPNGRPLPPHYADTREFAATYRRRISTPPVANRREETV